MSTRIQSYVHQALAGSGLAILDSQIMAKLRPDLWGANGGLEAAWEVNKFGDNLGTLGALRQFVVRIQGRDREVMVVARSSEYLAMRIEWILGEFVLDVLEITSAAPQVTATPAVPRTSSASIDRYPGVFTKEPGRRCGECDHLTAGHACRKSAQSGMEHPPGNVTHRCLEFKAKWDSLDKRDGCELWPELVVATA